MTDGKIGPMLEPAIIVVFGVTGDLAQRYLLPALYHLFKDNLLHEHTVVLGLSRQDISTDELFSKVELCINETDKACDPTALAAMESRTQMLRFDPNTGDDYAGLLQKLNAIETEHGLCMNRLYYLSIPPKVFPAVVQHLGEHGLNGSCQHGTAATRLLVEKPFGSDMQSAQALIDATNAVFKEEQVYRIDHYLAKETVQNILTFRHFNPIFASIWSNQHIQSIDISAYESIGIEGRANFYEGLGALRDLIQSHLLQLLAITTMHMPETTDSLHLHEAKQALLASVLAADPAKAHRGQYQTYRAEVQNPTSTTETFARLELTIDDEEWEAVRISVATGKALQSKRTEIAVTFTDRADPSDAVNALIFRIQPNEGIHLQLRVKKPGFERVLQDAAMDFSYQTTFGDVNHPNAYERVLVDAVKGDQTLFATSAEVLESWRILQPVLDAWDDNDDGLQTYANGSAGLS